MKVYIYYFTISLMAFFNFDNHHFEGDLPRLLKFPLTMTLQVTRRCNLKCIYCSENLKLPEPPKEDLDDIIKKLKKVKRIIVSGGEPLIRKDIFLILKQLKEDKHIVSLATNATLITPKVASKLNGLVDYVDITIDGPRNIHNLIRGSYDKILEGIFNLKNAGVEYSFVTVLLPQNLNYLRDICQIVDVLGGKKHKILTPIPKGKGKEIYSKVKGKYPLNKIYEEIKNLKKELGWKQRITITDWNRIGEGHALLIHPDGDVVESPIFSNNFGINLLGNLHKEELGSVWNKYTHKREHYRKYLEKSMYVI